MDHGRAENSKKCRSERFALRFPGAFAAFARPTDQTTKTTATATDFGYASLTFVVGRFDINANTPSRPHEAAPGDPRLMKQAILTCPSEPHMWQDLEHAWRTVSGEISLTESAAEA